MANLVSSTSKARRPSVRHVVFRDALSLPRRPLNFGQSSEVTCENRAADALNLDERSFVNWIFDRAGLRRIAYRQETIARRLPACLRFLRVGSILQSRAKLEAEPSLLAGAIDTLVIGVTSFFRDPSVFRAIKDVLLPRLCASRRKPIRVWSVGCSEGQELYSIAILLAEIGALNRAYLLGTDCRNEAVRHAAAGVYDARDVRSVPHEWLGRYFARNEQAGGWRIDPRLRTLVQWRTSSVLDLIEPGEWDLILCRNMVMYFAPEFANVVWYQLQRALAPGGWLVVGKAERPGTGLLVPAGPCLFRSIRG